MRGLRKTRLAWQLALAVLGTLWAVGAAAADLPPVGKRRYVIDGDNRYAPVAIKKGREGEEKAVVLKDPLQPSKDAKVDHVPKRAPVVHRPVSKPVVKKAAKAGHLRFGKMAVQGHVAQPRVEFTSDTVPLERADEPIYQDFFNKIFAPAEDAAF